MKKFFCLTFLLAPLALNAASPSETCPSDWWPKIIEDDGVIIATDCDALELLEIDDAESCLNNTADDNGECYIFAPVGISYTDDTGTYEYAEPCMLE